MGERPITLSGGGPWGFTLSGGKDFGAPLKVSKVSEALLFHRAMVYNKFYYWHNHKNKSSPYFIPIIPIQFVFFRLS